MKEIPMLFNTAMVRAILEERKTQTRRLTRETFVRENPIAKGYFENEGGQPVKAPARVGDRIYVRETIRPAWTRELGDGAEYAADHAVLPVDVENDASGDRHHRRNLAFNWGVRCECAYDDNGNNTAKWIPSIHMPKWAARIWLEVTGVRAEPLQHITVRDAMAEGCARMRDFPVVWDECYGETPFCWKRNPYVWVIGFRRVANHGA